MKVTKTEIRFKTGFQQPKTGLPKKPVLTSLVPIRFMVNWKPTFLFGLELGALLSSYLEEELYKI